MNKLWPITVTTSRYQGTYSGGRWLAFHCSPDGVPHQAFANDVTCAHWFDSLQSRWVGRGRTADEAVHNLRERLDDSDPPEAMRATYEAGPLKAQFGLDYNPDPKARGESDG